MNAEVPTNDHRHRPSHRQTTGHRGRRGAKRANKPEPPALPLQTAQSMVSSTPPDGFRPFTVGAVVEYHLECVKVDADGNSRSRGSLKNHGSAIRSFLDSFLTADGRSEGQREPGGPSGGAEDLVDVGGLLLNFGPTLLAHLTKLEADGKSRHTISDRRSILHSFRESCLKLVRTLGLPEDLGAAILHLCRLGNYSLAEVARGSHVPTFALHLLVEGRIPGPKSLSRLGRLEDFFKIPRGALCSKIPDAVRWLGGKLPTGTTRWRAHHGALTRSRYKLTRLTPGLQREWDLLYRLQTDPDWAEEQGFETSSEWRIRSDGSCPAGDARLSLLLGFFGYLRLDPDSADPWQRGRGFAEDALSIALLALPELVEGYLDFVRERSCGGLYNTYTKNVFVFVEQLLRPQTGFLYQQPSFGSRLPQPVLKCEWRGWCEGRLREVQKIRKRIFPPQKRKRRKNQARLVGMTRDPFAVVKDYIEGLEQPITVLWDLAANMEALVPFQKKGSPGRMATLARDLFYVKMIAANPLRCRNYAMMLYIPKDWDAFERACEQYRREGEICGLYVETEGNSNLYQRRDGSWWLRFEPPDFKNEVGAAADPYDVPVVEDVWPALVEYLFKHRSVLLRLAKAVIGEFRERNNLPPLSAEEGMKIDRCPYVLRPNERGFYGRSKAGRTGYTGAEQMDPLAVSKIIYYRSRRHLPSCKGFCAHACRYLVASHYIKNDPDGWKVAAAVLHDRVETIKKHYAWVRAADRIKPWNLHYAELKRRYEAGEL